MASFAEIARVTTAGKSLDTVTDGSEKSNAYLVYKSIVQQIKAAGQPTTRYHKGPDGAMIEGYEWHGTMATVVHDLWPVESTIPDSVTRQSMGHLINRYLRHTANAICVVRNGAGKPPVWWIRKEWNDNPPVQSAALQGLVPTYAEKRLTPDEAGENRAAAPVVVTTTAAKDTGAASIPAPPGTTLTFQEPTPMPMLSPTPTAPRKSPPPVPAPPATRQAGVEVVRGRANFVLTKDGKPAPPTYPVACGLTDVAGIPCRRVFTAASAAGLHRASHDVMNRLIENAADIVAADAKLTGANVVEPLGLHQTAIYSYFPTLNDLYYAGRMLAEKRAVAAARNRALKEARQEKTAQYAAETTDATRLAQLLVGFCHAIGIPVNQTTMNVLPLPIPATDRGKFVTHLVGENLIRYVDSLDNAGRRMKILVPGVAFDGDIARQLDAFRSSAAAGPATRDEVTSEDAAKLDILVVMQLAMDEINSLREAEPVLKAQDEQLVTLAADREAALQLATKAADKYEATAKALQAAERRTTELQAALDVITGALRGVPTNK